MRTVLLSKHDELYLEKCAQENQFSYGIIVGHVSAIRHVDFVWFPRSTESPLSPGFIRFGWNSKRISPRAWWSTWPGTTRRMRIWRTCRRSGSPSRTSTHRHWPPSGWAPAKCVPDLLTSSVGLRAAPAVLSALPRNNHSHNAKAYYLWGPCIPPVDSKFSQTLFFLYVLYMG